MLRGSAAVISIWGSNDQLQLLIHRQLPLWLRWFARKPFGIWILPLPNASLR